MTDALPQDMPELETARGYDSARLIGQVRLGDMEAIREGYRMKFGDALGRVLLLHALTEIGRIGVPRMAETPAESNHTNGRGWAVLTMAGLAGFDPVAIGAAGMTQILEGADYEHGYGSGRPDRPDVHWGDHGGDGFDGGADDGTGGELDPDGAAFGS